MTGKLVDHIQHSMAATAKPTVVHFATSLARKAGAVAALFYGSNLRTGELEGVLDFYLLLPGPPPDRIWPRVSYHEEKCGNITLRAKTATMSLGTFADACAGRSRDTTIWARFVQPAALIWCVSPDVRAEVVDALEQAACTAARLAVALGPEQGIAHDYWRALFGATYQAELRVEKPGRENSILSANEAHFNGLLPAALHAAGIPYTSEGEYLTPRMDEKDRRDILAWWHRCRRWGKPLNIIRLVKASTTFDGAANYAAWKIERHTGVPVEVTPWREKHPILAAPGVLLSVWRKRKNDKG